MSKDKREARAVVKAEQDKVKVKMRFTEEKYYNDPNTPHFEKGKIYEVQGQDIINRWLKRGGEIVTDEMLKKEAQDAAKAKVEAPKKSEEAPVNPVEGSEKKDEDKPEPLSTKQKSK